MLPVASPSVIYRSMPDGAVLFSSTSEVYFGLNSVGAAVWENLPPANYSLVDLCHAISRLYPEAPLETIRADVEELLAELEQNGLVSPQVTAGIQN